MVPYTTESRLNVTLPNRFLPRYKISLRKPGNTSKLILSQYLHEETC